MHTRGGSRLTFPVGPSLVDGIDDVEGLGVLLLERVELLLEKNVLLTHVSEDEGEAGLVGGVLERKVENLVHGGAAEGRSAPIRALREGQLAYMPLPPAIIPTSSNWLTDSDGVILALEGTRNKDREETDP